MSDTTLYSGLYQQIGIYADLVDDVLVTLINKSSQPNYELHKRLGELLIELTSKSHGNLSAKMIAQLIYDDDDGITEAELIEAAEALEAGIADDVTKEILERLARCLEQERTKVMARIRGERR